MWAGVAVIAQTFFAVSAFVAVERLAQASEGIKEGKQSSSALGQGVLDVGRAAAEIMALD